MRWLILLMLSSSFQLSSCQRRRSFRRSRRDRDLDPRRATSDILSPCPSATTTSICPASRTYPLASRKSKAHASDFAKVVSTRFGSSGAGRVAARDARGGGLQGGRRRDAGGARVERRHRLGPRRARDQDRASRPCSSISMERGFVSAIAMNGAGIIHDFEVALSGATSEDVDEALGPGRFGMAEETGTLLNAAINEGVAAGKGHRPGGRRTPARDDAAARGAEPRRGGGAPRRPGHRARRDRHRHHPHAPGRVRRGARRRQPARFPLLRLERRAAARRRLPECGSAVVLPEVFLKAVALARNRGISLDGLTTVNLDFIAPLSAADQRRAAARPRGSGRATRSSATTRS